MAVLQQKSTTVTNVATITAVHVDSQPLCIMYRCQPVVSCPFQGQEPMTLPPLPNRGLPVMHLLLAVLQILQRLLCA